MKSSLPVQFKGQAQGAVTAWAVGRGAPGMRRGRSGGCRPVADLALCGMVLERNGEIIATGAGAAALGSPVNAVGIGGLGSCSVRFN